jgi:hypothetical protein
MVSWCEFKVYTQSCCVQVLQIIYRLVTNLLILIRAMTCGILTYGKFVSSIINVC